MSSFQRGEEQAFDCLFRNYFAALSYFANELLKDKAAAEDIVQDRFMHLWQRRNQLHSVRHIKSYLYRSVRNACLDQLAKEKRQQVSLPEATIDEATIETATIAAETARQLYQLVESLSPALRQIIRMYYLEGLSNQQIAMQLNIEPDTVIRQRLRGLMALRKQQSLLQ